MTSSIFDPSWLGQEPGQLPTRAIKACLAWLDRAIPSLPPQDKAKYLGKRELLQAEFRRRFAQEAGQAGRGRPPSGPPSRPRPKKAVKQGGWQGGLAGTSRSWPLALSTAPTAGSIYNPWNLWGSR
jgi:hypothetical protein